MIWYENGSTYCKSDKYFYQSSEPRDSLSALEIDQALLAHTETETGSPSKKN